MVAFLGFICMLLVVVFGAFAALNWMLQSVNWWRYELPQKRCICIFITAVEAWMLPEFRERLCHIFEGVEQLLITAASLHLKFLEAPRLSEAIFSDFYKFYLPKTGTGSQNSDIEKVRFSAASQSSS